MIYVLHSLFLSTFYNMMMNKHVLMDGVNLMWKSTLWFCMFFVLFLSGCSTNNEANLLSKLENYDVKSIKEEVKEGDFIYRLYTEQEEYPNGNSVKIYAELEYIGDLEEITIFHAASPFYFPMEEKIRGIQISYPMQEPLLSTSLKKGEPIRKEYSPSGAYSEEDENEYKDFLKNFLQYGFPSGYYVVNGYADFFIETTPNEELEKFHPTAQIDFKVK